MNGHMTVRKWMLCAVAFCVAFGAAADEAKPYDPRTKPTNDAERKIRMEWLMKRKYERTGGTLIRKDSMQGEIAVVNCQKAAGKDILERSIEYLKKESRLKITLRDGTFSFPSPKIEGNASLYVIDDPSLPTLLAAPENRWTVLNVAPLKTGRGASPAFFKARVLKEMSRGFALLCGAMSSNFPGSLTSGMYKPEDLDRISDERLSLDVLARMAPYLEPIGVTPAIYVSYRQACKEGWAEKPKDAIQQKIWDEVKSDKERGPTNPIGIPPPNAKK